MLTHEKEAYPGPDAPQTPSAADRVFSVYELLELILLDLPMRDLLHSQRVCRTWKSVVCRSSSVQQALFFTSKSRRHAGRPEQEHWESNELLAMEFAPWFDLEYVRSRWDWPTARSIKKLPWANRGDERKTQAFMRREASWRRMLVTQPAIQDVQMVVKCDHVRDSICDDYVEYVPPSGRGRREHDESSVPVETIPGAGVTMGFLYDIASDFALRKHVVSRFYVQWRPFHPPDGAGYVSDEDDEDEGFTQEPDDVTGWGTPSWRRRDVEARDTLTVHLAYTAQHGATLLPEPQPHLRSEGYAETGTYRQLLRTSARFVALEGLQPQLVRPDDLVSCTHDRHRLVILTWNDANLPQELSYFDALQVHKNHA